MATFTDLVGTAQTFTDHSGFTLAEITYDDANYDYDSDVAYYDYGLILAMLTALVGAASTFTDLTT